MELGTRLKLLRKNSNLSQDEFANRLNLSRGAVGMWETNKRTPDLEMIIKIALYFGVSTDYILGLADNSTQSSEAPALTDECQKLLDTFQRLNPDNQDILIGEAKKLLKEQLREERITPNSPLKKAE